MVHTQNSSCANICLRVLHVCRFRVIVRFFSFFNLLPSSSQHSSKVPPGKDMLAPSTMACARAQSPPSAATAAALRASQISRRPSKAGAVSQNSALFERNWPSVIGVSLLHLSGSFRKAWFLPIVIARSYRTVGQSRHVNNRQEKYQPERALISDQNTK